MELHFPTFLGESMSQKSYGNSCSSTAPSSTHTSSTEHCAIQSIWCICTATWARAGCGLALGPQMIKLWPLSNCLCLSSWLRSLKIWALRENLWKRCRNITGRHKIALQRATREEEAGAGHGLFSCSEREGEVLPPTTEKQFVVLFSQFPIQVV